MKHRIQKLLAAAGVASRRACEDMVRQGRVSVNGKTVVTLPVMIDPEADHITVDGQRIRLAPRRKGGQVRPARDGAPTQQHYYVMMNKPKGVLCTNVAQGDQICAIDLLPRDFPVRVYPVGRLDAQSKGLLLLTNDGELTNRLTHPRYGVIKTYRAIVDGRVTQETLDALPPDSKIRIVKRFPDRSLLEISLRERANQQLRPMLAKLGHKVRELTRTGMGPLTLDGLDVGQMRTLFPKEVRMLRRYRGSATVPE